MCPVICQLADQVEADNWKADSNLENNTKDAVTFTIASGV